MASNSVTISETMRFKVYCTLEYSRIHSIPITEVLDLFEKHGVMKFLEIEELRWQTLSDTVYEIDDYIRHHPRKNRTKP